MSEDELDLDFGEITKFFKKKKAPDVKQDPEEQEAEPEVREQSEKHPQEAKPETGNNPESDDISFDFSKIKSFFKGSKGSDDDISIDFSRIKSFFKGTEENHETGEISFDFSKVVAIVKRHPTLILFVFLLLMQFVPNEDFLICRGSFVCPWGGVWSRMQAGELRMTDDWAQNAVTNFYRGQIDGAVNQQYPNLPDAQRNKLVDEQWEKVRKEQDSTINQQIEVTRQQIKDHWQYESDGTKYTYMPDIDPYFWLRYARNIINFGRYGDEIVDGQELDTRMFAPNFDKPQSNNKHPVVLAWIYKVFHVFNSNITLMQAAGYFPILAMLLSFLFAFLAARKLGGNIAGVFAAALIILLPAVAGRTLFGHADTDAYNIMFPLLITWLFFEVMSSKGWKIGAWSAGLFASIFAYSKFWVVWYMINFMVVGVVAFTVFRVWKHRKGFLKNKNLWWPIVGSGGAAVLALMFTKGISSIMSIISNTLAFTKLKVAAHETLWPNVYTTVAELNPGSVNAAINSVGSWVFWIGVLGLVFMMFKTKKKDENVAYAFFLGAWFIAALYATTKGIRFSMLLAPAVALAFGAAIGLGRDYASRFARQMNINKAFSTVVVVAFGVLLLVYPSNVAAQSLQAAKNDVPLVNDAWWNSLKAIEADSQKNAIITSWWDFGHHFKFIADRAVNFDGGSQNTPKAYWVGKLLLTGNEDEAVGILRMLDCGGNDAFDVLVGQNLSAYAAIKTLNKIILMDKLSAEAYLEKIIGFPRIHAQNVTSLTHCNPPEGYLIASNDMIGKAGVWGHFGSWDFIRAETWIKWRHLPRDEAVPQMQEQYNISEAEAGQLYSEAKALVNDADANKWIAPWPSFMGGETACTEDNSTLRCGNGLTITDGNGSVQTSQGEQPVRIARVEKGGGFSVTEKGPGIGALVWPTENGWNSILVQSPLEESMFMRLFFVRGHGLKHFDLLSEQTQIVQQGKIFVWEVNWTGRDAPNILESAKIHSVVEPGATVRLNYVGWLDNGTVFDASVKDWQSINITKDVVFSDYETTPLMTTFGNNELLPRFEEQIAGLTKGQSTTFRLLPSEGYVDESHPMFNLTLHFRVEVSDIK